MIYCWFYPGLDELNNTLMMSTAALFSLKHQWEIWNFVKRQLSWEERLYLSSLFYSRWFVSLFLFWSEQNDALKNCCIDLFHTVILFTFLEGQVHQMECNLVFSNHYIALHLMCLPFKICKQKHCMRKVSIS